MNGYGNRNDVVTVRVLQRLKWAVDWKVGETHEVNISYIPGREKTRPRAGSRLILFGGWGRHSQVQIDLRHGCPLVPLNESNLTLVRRGIDQDYTVRKTVGNYQWHWEPLDLTQELSVPLTTMVKYNVNRGIIIALVGASSGHPLNLLLSYCYPTLHHKCPGLILLQKVGGWGGSRLTRFSSARYGKPAVGSAALC